MVFNIIARNCDDHTKNFAFRLKKKGKWELAPAYDICHAYRPGSEWVSQHSLSINNKRKDFTKEDLMIIGKSINHKKASGTIEEIIDTVKHWKKYANSVNINPKLRDAIGKTLLNLK